VTLYQNNSLQIEVNIEASSYCVFSYFTFRGDELAVNKYIIRGAHPGCSKHQVFMWLVSVDPQVKGDAAITGNYSTINSMPVPWTRCPFHELGEFIKSCSFEVVECEFMRAKRLILIKFPFTVKFNNTILLKDPLWGVQYSLASKGGGLSWDASLKDAMNK
jgi:hypothetical protein